jgi:ABC-type glycerol-3-phosphate transport system substrate-binding protein
MEYQGWDEALRQNLLNSLMIGAAPDIVVGENYFQQLIEMEALVPLDDAISDIQDDLIPGTLKAVQREGSTYGLSSFTGVFGFERNCEVVTAAGLDCDTPPRTWDDLLEHARIITERGNGAYYGYTLQGPAGFAVGSVLRIAVFLAQADASICQNNCTEPYFNNPKAVPVMELIRKLNQYTLPGLTFHSDEAQVYAALYQGRSAYQIAGSWYPDVAKGSGCSECYYSTVPAPKHGHPASIIVGNAIYAVLKQSRYPELAVEWVKFLTRPDVQELVYPSIKRLPSTRSALTNLRPLVEPSVQVFIDELLNNPELGVLPQWRKSPEVLWRIYNTMLTQVLTSERPVKEIMDEAQAAAEAIE